MAGIIWSFTLYFLSTVYSAVPDGLTSNELGNQRHLYDTYAEIQCQFQSVTYDNITEGYFKVLRQSNYDVGDYSFSYQTAKSNSSSKSTPDTMSVDRFTLNPDGSLTTSLKWSDLSGGWVYLTIQNEENGESWQYEWPILEGDPLVLKESNVRVPVFQNYILKTDSFQIESADPGVSVVYLYQYKHEFDPARPPISTGSGASGRNLNIDSVWSVEIGEQILLEDPGLYFVQSDSSSLEGISFRITDNSYPKAGTVKSLVEPLKYITTKSEYQQLLYSDEPKKAFDRFWLEQTNNEQIARKNIKAYFQRFAWSNQVFTSYKEGWKTDRGMIYMIFGLPLEVERLPNREEWTYQRYNGQVIFTFMKVPNIFTNEHYELVRSSSYDDFWFATLDAWRKGELTR